MTATNEKLDGAHLVFDKPITDESCYELWGAAIKRALIDADMPELAAPARTDFDPDQRGYRLYKNRLSYVARENIYRDQAIAWFKSEDFDEICLNLGTDPEGFRVDLKRAGQTFGVPDASSDDAVGI